MGEGLWRSRRASRPPMATRWTPASAGRAWRGVPRRPRGSRPRSRRARRARLRVAVDLCEAVADATLFDFPLGQLPDHPGRTGSRRLSRPTTSAAASACSPPAPRPRSPTAASPASCWAAGPSSSRRQGPPAGLPLRRARPRAPQAILLCCAENDPGFSLDLVRDMRPADDRPDAATGDRARDARAARPVPPRDLRAGQAPAGAP